MTIHEWDPDQAVNRGKLDEDLEGAYASDRYGVTGREEITGEPLDVALAQEEPDVTPTVGADDEWLDVEDEDARLFEDQEEVGPEERAMHVVTP